MMILREWHKRIGIGAFVFMFWLGFSGILLNQSPGLGLDAKRVDWSWLMSLYGLHAVTPKTGYASGNHWLAVRGDALVIDGAQLNVPAMTPVGFVIAGGGSPGLHLIYVASADGVVIASTDGKVVDQLDSHTLPTGPVQAIGTIADTGQVVIRGNGTYASSDGGLTWLACNAPHVTWSMRSALTPEQQEAASRFGRPSVPIEQILIDFHSGRIFGPIGQYVVDVVGGGAVLLAMSGMWMALRIGVGRRRVAVR